MQNNNNNSSQNEQQNNITGDVTNVNTITADELTFNSNANPNATSSDSDVHPTTDTSQPATTNSGRSFRHTAATGFIANRTNRQHRSTVNANSRRDQLLLFNSSVFIDHFDKRECSNIYGAICAVNMMNMVDDIVKEIAEYATGMAHSCLNCDKSISILHSKSQSEGFYYNPNGVIHAQGEYDVNNDIVVYCRSCEERIVQCAYFINKNSYGYMINDGLPFTKLFCSFRFVPSYNIRKCAKCLGGVRTLMIAGNRVRISCTHSRNSYSHSNGNINIGNGNNNYDCEIM